MAGMTPLVPEPVILRVPMSASRAVRDRSRTRCPDEIIGGERLVVAQNGSRRKANGEGPREVLVGESPDGLRWVVRAGPDTDGGFYTSITGSFRDATAESDVVGWGGLIEYLSGGYAAGASGSRR